MKSLAQGFLSHGDREKIIQAVREAEQGTAGEIVPMVVSRSYSYPMADIIGGGVLALPAALALSRFINTRFWISDPDHWIFMGILTLCFVSFHQACKRILWLKRLFISQREIEEEVDEAATLHFFREGLQQTRERTGILIFISVFERRVRVLGDQGITEKVSKDQWDRIVHIITDGIRQKNQAEAVCLAVKEAGRILRTHFPMGPHDRNELKDLVIK
ncbi:MAG: TPM domain-containing protein [Desulfobacteraceae bacterium]|nr:TPM domain-containing protein [Desulfobacteraceae bacterium]